jgi:hypothetical protein
MSIVLSEECSPPLHQDFHGTSLCTAKAVQCLVIPVRFPQLSMREAILLVRFCFAHRSRGVTSITAS